MNERPWSTEAVARVAENTSAAPSASTRATATGTVTVSILREGAVGGYPSIPDEGCSDNREKAHPGVGK